MVSEVEQVLGDEVGASGEGAEVVRSEGDMDGMDVGKDEVLELPALIVDDRLAALVLG